MTVSDDELSRAAEALRRGAVVAAATESFFGLLADPFDESALAKVFRLKGRDATRASALIAPDVASWARVVAGRPALAETFAAHFWPGPLTLVLPAAPHLPEGVVMAGRVGVRVPGPCPAARLCSSFGGVLTATSANLAGEPPCTQAEQIRELFPDAIAAGELVVLAEPAPGGVASTLVSVAEDGYEILRAGAVSREQLEQAARRAV